MIFKDLGERLLGADAPLSRKRGGNSDATESQMQDVRPDRQSKYLAIDAAKIARKRNKKLGKYPDEIKNRDPNQPI